MMQLHSTFNKKKFFQEAILIWAKSNLRPFSWRNNLDPYCILISEVLLQKTDAAKVEKIYPKFIEKYPTVMHIHQAELKDIETIISKIGLFNKAKRFQKIAEQIIQKHEGKIPENKEEIMDLYGVGEYISNAILCFGFKRRVPIVDVNILRIYSRVFGVKSTKSRPHTDKMIWDFAESMLPEKSYIEYNYALLDFASITCKSKQPLCYKCPIREICKYRELKESNSHRNLETQ